MQHNFKGSWPYEYNRGLRSQIVIFFAEIKQDIGNDGFPTKELGFWNNKIFLHGICEGFF